MTLRRDWFGLLVSSHEKKNVDTGAYSVPAYPNKQKSKNQGYFFFENCQSITPPKPMTEMPIRGDQLSEWGSSRITSMGPKSTTFLLVKNCMVVKMVSASPMIIIVNDKVFILVVVVFNFFFLKSNCWMLLVGGHARNCFSECIKVFVETHFEFLPIAFIGFLVFANIWF